MSIQACKNCGSIIDIRGGNQLLSQGTDNYACYGMHESKVHASFCCMRCCENPIGSERCIAYNPITVPLTKFYRTQVLPGDGTWEFLCSIPDCGSGTYSVMMDCSLHNMPILTNIICCLGCYCKYRVLLQGPSRPAGPSVVDMRQFRITGHELLCPTILSQRVHKLGATYVLNCQKYNRPTSAVVTGGASSSDQDPDGTSRQLTRVSLSY